MKDHFTGCSRRRSWAVAAFAVGSGISEAQPSTSAWPMLGNDARHTGAERSARPEVPGQRRTGPERRPVRSRSTTRSRCSRRSGANGDGLRRHGLAVLRDQSAGRDESGQSGLHARSGSDRASRRPTAHESLVLADQRRCLGQRGRGRQGRLRLFRRPGQLDLQAARLGRRTHVDELQYQGQTFQLPVAPNPLQLDATATGRPCRLADDRGRRHIYFGFSQTCDGNGTIMASRTPARRRSTIKWKLRRRAVRHHSRRRPSPRTRTTASQSSSWVRRRQGPRHQGQRHAGIDPVEDTDRRRLDHRLPGDRPGRNRVRRQTTMPCTRSIARRPARSSGRIRWGRTEWTRRPPSASNGILYFVSRFGEPADRLRDQPGRRDATQNPQGGPPVDIRADHGLAIAGGFPIIGADGIVYVGMGNGVYALQPNSGAALEIPDDQRHHLVARARHPETADAPATATASGTAVLYFGSQDRKLYAITSHRTGLAQNDPPVAVCRSPRASRYRRERSSRSTPRRARTPTATRSSTRGTSVMARR